VAELASTVDVAQFRRALGLWASGVTVITTRHNGLIYSMTASSFSSLLVDPLEILVCVARSSRFHDAFMASGAFAVNILRDDQRALAEAFASRTRAPQALLDAVETFDGPSGSPVFSPCLAYLDCRTARVFDGGDHSIVIGSVLAAGADESARPLLYFNRNYRGIHDLE